MLKVIFVIFLFFNIAYSRNLDQSSIQMLIKVSRIHNIDPKLLISIAIVESKANRFTIAYNLDRDEIALHKAYLNLYNIKYSVGRYRSNYRIAIFPSNKKEAKLAFKLSSYRKNVDYGFMGINSSHFKSKSDRLEALLNTEKNIEYSAKVLKSCFDYFNKSISKTVECYNKGTNEKKFNYSYYKKLRSCYNVL